MFLITDNFCFLTHIKNIDTGGDQRFQKYIYIKIKKISFLKIGTHCFVMHPFTYDSPFHHLVLNILWHRIDL